MFFTLSWNTSFSLDCIFFCEILIGVLKSHVYQPGEKNILWGKKKTNLMISLDDANQKIFSSNSTFTSMFCQGEFHLHVLQDSLEALWSYILCLMLEQEQHPGISFAVPSDIIFFCIFPRRKDSAHFSCSCLCLPEIAAYTIRFSHCIFCIFPESRIR